MIRGIHSDKEIAALLVQMAIAIPGKLANEIRVRMATGNESLRRRGVIKLCRQTGPGRPLRGRRARRCRRVHGQPGEPLAQASVTIRGKGSGRDGAGCEFAPRFGAGPCPSRASERRWPPLALRGDLLGSEEPRPKSPSRDEPCRRGGPLGSRHRLTGRARGLFAPNGPATRARASRWDGVLLVLWRWCPPNLCCVLRCPECQRADVSIRWPERFAFCDRCGERVPSEPPPGCLDA